MPAYLSSRLSSRLSSLDGDDGDDGDERAPPFYYTRRRFPIKSGMTSSSIYMDKGSTSIFAKKKKRSQIKRNASTLYIFKAKNFNLHLY